MILTNRSRLRWVAAAAALIALASACSPGSREGRAMRLKLVAGSARLIREGSTSSVRSQLVIKPGDRIVLSKGGVAELTLGEGRSFEISDAEVEVLSKEGLRLQRGNLLADLLAPGRVESDSISASSRRGAFRVDKGLSTRIGVYQGSVQLESPGASLALSRLREAVVAAGVLPGRGRPLQLANNDRWDRRYLRDALDLDARLRNFGRGLESQLGRSSGLEFYTRLFPETDVSFLGPYASHRRADVVIASAISMEVAPDDGQKFQGVLSATLALWVDGASWGLVAYEYGVGQVGLFGRLLEFVRRAGVTTSGFGSGTGERRQNGGGTNPSPEPSPSKASPGSPSPSPTVPTTGVSPLDQIINQVIGTVSSPSVPSLP